MSTKTVLVRRSKPVSTALFRHPLGLPIPHALEGRLPAGALDPKVLEARPPRFADVAAPTAVGEIALDAEAEAEILARLQALGYVE